MSNGSDLFRSTCCHLVAVVLVLSMFTSRLAAQDDKVHHSREYTVIVEPGRATGAALGVLVSRELQLLVDTLAIPEQIQELTVTLSSDRNSATLDWSGYDELRQHDVSQFQVFIGTRPIYDVQGLKPHRTVPAGTPVVEVSDIDPAKPTYFAVVAVDFSGRLDTQVHHAGAYPVVPSVSWREITLRVDDDVAGGIRKTVSRELGLLIGGTGQRVVLSRELAIVNAARRAPDIVTELHVARNVAGLGAKLDWSDYNEVAQKGLAGYRVFQSSSPFKSVAGLEPLAELTAGTKNLHVRDLDPNASVYFAVVPVGQGGGFSSDVVYAGGYTTIPRVSSREVGLIVDGDGNTSARVVSRELSILRPDQTPPVMVTGLGANGAHIGSSVLLDWSNYDEVGQRDVHHYRIYVKNKFFETIDDSVPIANVPAGVSTYLVRSLKPGSRVYFAVVAEDALGNLVSRVQPASAVPRDALPPPEVTDLQVASGETQLRFSWRLPPGNHDLSGFRVRFGDRPPVTLPPDVFRFKVSELSPATSYEFRVCAVDFLSNESAGRITTGVTLLANPQDLVAVVGEHPGGVGLAWTPVEPRSLVKNYAVYVSGKLIRDVSGLSPAKVVASSETLVDLEGFPVGVPRYFAVTTINLSGGQNRSVVPVSATPTADQSEPNDTIASAQSIEPGNTFSVTLRALPNQMDLDIFRVMVDRDAVLTVQYANTESDPHRPSLRWLDKTGQLIGEGRTDLWVPAGSEVLLEFSTSAPARSGGLRFSSFEPRLVMTYTSDRYEPNDSIDTASVLAVGRRIAAELNVSDVDHFRLVLPDAGTYVADIDQLNGLILQWTDANGRVLSRVRQLVLSSPGPVLLRVALQPNNRGGSTPYSLQVLKIGGDPTLEPGMYPRYPPPLKVKQLSDLIQ